MITGDIKVKDKKTERRDKDHAVRFSFFYFSQLLQSLQQLQLPPQDDPEQL